MAVDRQTEPHIPGLFSYNKILEIFCGYKELATRNQLFGALDGMAQTMRGLNSGFLWNQVFWDVTLHRSVSDFRRFEGA